MARDVGSKKVFMASCAPPIRYSNVYGIDMPSRAELVAHGRTVADVAKVIDADAVVYQTLPGLIESVHQLNRTIPGFDCSIFDNVYVTGGVDEKYLAGLEQTRSDNEQSKKAGNTIAAQISEPQTVMSCSGPMNGAEDIGLYNGWSR